MTYGKTISYLGGVTAVLVFSIVGLINLVNSQPPTQTPATEPVPALSKEQVRLLETQANESVKGTKTETITLVEYSDFQCPACANYYPLVQQLSQEFGERVRIVYRHFPLQQHQNAKIAAISAEAAGKQGKFWEMHDLIFSKQTEWAETKNAQDYFSNYAQSLGLNIDQFKKDLDNKELADKVNKDYESGVQLGVTYTPTFFLNGKKISNPRGYDEFKKVIESELKKT